MCAPVSAATRTRASRREVEEKFADVGLHGAASRMNLSAIIQGTGARGDAAGDPEIALVTGDSREVVPRAVFFALPGAERDGHDFVPEAVRRGAVAIVAERAVACAPAALLLAPSARRAMAIAAANFQGHPAAALRLAAVTGTNGKTTVAWLVEACARAARLPVGMLGTVTHRWPGTERAAAHTTPESTTIQALLAEMRAAGARAAVLEVSSHALAQERVAGIRFAAAGFTNLTRDHLDYHGDMERYFAAKRRLFIEHLSPDGVAAVRSPLVGAHNVENLLSAAGLALALDLPTDAISRALSECGGAPGRLERFAARGVSLFVDYAHTDDALTRALEALRALAPRRLVCVFGCGGDRDAGKRPLMGEAAGRAADAVVVTSDNPRGEDPAAILDAIVPGLERARLRRRARPPRRHRPRGRERAGGRRGAPRRQGARGGPDRRTRTAPLLGSRRGAEGPRDRMIAPRFTPDELAAATGGRWTGTPPASIEGVSTDTRTIGAGSLFVALRGERFDAHAFLADAAAKGAAAAAVSEEWIAKDSVRPEGLEPAHPERRPRVAGPE